MSDGGALQRMNNERHASSRQSIVQQLLNLRHGEVKTNHAQETDKTTQHNAKQKL